MNNKETFDIGNYCVSFIDLLGQRLEYKNEGRLPKFESPEEKERFKKKVHNTVGAIDNLQRRSSSFVKAALNYKSSRREELQRDGKRLYDEMKEFHLKQQRWSDGLVYFVSLMKDDVKCKMSGVYYLLLTVGVQCFIGLASKQPLRGSIDIAWATELHPGELYGVAVAKAYELESEVAKYPRIIVGPRFVEYLITNVKDPASDIYSQHNRELAKLCYDMLAIDFDGYHFIHYLGNVFRMVVTTNHHEELYEYAVKFIIEQCKKWRDERDTKLSLRYNHLLSYFLAHPPSESQEDLKA